MIDEPLSEIYADAHHPDSVQATPEGRLEHLRFFAVERGDLPKALGDWMFEVEQQVSNLRKRLNDLPGEYARKGPVW